MWTLALLLLTVPAGRAIAQDWNAPPALELVRRAAAAHAGEPAGRPFRARARGLVTFHVELVSDGAPVARLMRVDEIDLEVRKSGAGPSRQVIRAWRDSTLFPSGTSYHRDHLGIVTDDFGPTIRLGDGDEVAEVPHPLSAAGAAIYEFQVRDTVRLTTSAGTLVVVSVAVRPRDGATPAVVGTLDLERSTAALVRSRFTFTGAAYRDPDLEDIAVRLERSLVDGAVWLPHRQEIEIRRRSAVLDTPLRGVIRGRWLIDDYDLAPAFEPGDFAGPPIGGLRRPGGPPIWRGPLARALDSLPPAAGDADLARVRREALGVARARWLEGLPAVRPAVGRVSDVVRVNRVAGLVVGAGLRWRPAPGVGASLRAGVGTADGRLTGAAEVALANGLGRWTLSASRDVADVIDVAASSGLVGSLAAQEGGRDYGDYVLLERVALGWTFLASSATSVGVSLAREWAASVETAAQPARGSYRANPHLGSPPYWVVAGRLATRRQPLGGGVGAGSVATEVGIGDGSYWRALAEGSVSRRIAGGEATVRGLFGAGSDGLPARRSFAIGGRGTLPGENHRAWGGRRVGLVRLDWLHPVPWPGLPLGRYGRSAGEAWLGPFVATGWAAGDVGIAPWRASGDVRVVAGLAIDLLNRSVRVELGRSLRAGGSLGVTIDVARDWWPVL